MSLELQNQSQSMDVYWCMVVAFQELLSLGCEFVVFHAAVWVAGWMTRHPLYGHV